MFLTLIFVMHKCLSCKKTYKDDAPELLLCCECGSKYFLYYRTNNIYEKKSKDEIEKIEKDILEIIKDNKIEKGKVVVFDIESIIVPKQGKYLIDLQKLFKEKIVVFRIDEGKYIIEIPKK